MEVVNAVIGFGIGACTSPEFNLIVRPVESLEPLVSPAPISEYRHAVGSVSGYGLAVR
jgi:hypothetical protein